VGEGKLLKRYEGQNDAFWRAFLWSAQLKRYKYERRAGQGALDRWKIQLAISCVSSARKMTSPSDLLASIHQVQ
jgi:hypothetical protein